MNHFLRIALLIAILVYYLCIYYLLKEKKLLLKYSLLWIISGLIMILLVIFPQPFEYIMHLIGVVEMTNGLFAVVLLVLIFILISLTSIVSSQNSKIRQLVQQCAMYEKQLRQLEEQFNNMKKTKENNS